MQQELKWLPNLFKNFVLKGKSNQEKSPDIREGNAWREPNTVLSLPDNSRK